MANSLWIDAVRKGTSSTRPTVPDFPSETIGFFWETDTERMYMGVSGGSWYQVSAGPAAQSPGTEGTGVTIASVVPLAVQKLTLTLDGVEVAVPDANDYGGTAIYTWPDRNLAILGCEVDLTLTKDGTGYISTTDLDVGMGTAAASNATLATTMINVLPKQDVDTNSVTPTLQASNFTAVGTFAALAIPDASNNALYLNVSGATETSEDGTVTADGTIDIYFIDLGNRTS